LTIRFLLLYYTTRFFVNNPTAAEASAFQVNELPMLNCYL